MTFELVLSTAGVGYYGYIPFPTPQSKKNFEKYYLEEGDGDLLDEDFVDSIDAVCNALVDVGDVDYLNAEQCKILREWIADRLTRSCADRLKVLYAKLDEYAARAIELGTGVVIEL